MSVISASLASRRLLHRTHFRGAQLRDADFGDAGRIQSVIVDGRLLEGMGEIQEWLSRDAARVSPIPDPCPTANRFGIC